MADLIVGIVMSLINYMNGNNTVIVMPHTECFSSSFITNITMIVFTIAFTKRLPGKLPRTKFANQLDMLHNAPS